MRPADWGSKEWFESKFALATDHADVWGNQWRGSQRLRYRDCLSLIQPLLQSTHPVRILDIGCGLGDFTANVLQIKPANEVIGIDLAQAAIGRAARQYAGPTFLVSGLPDLPFGSKAFDLILCLEVLYYLKADDLIRSLDMMSTLLRPGGRFLLSGVLGNGTHYFQETDILRDVSSIFHIEHTHYDYDNVFERKLFQAMNILQRVRDVLLMSSVDFEMAYALQPNRKMRLLKLLRHAPLLPAILLSLLRPVLAAMRFYLSQAWPSLVVTHLTRIVLPQTGKRRITILARQLS